MNANIINAILLQVLLLCVKNGLRKHGYEEVEYLYDEKH